jgi:hydroxyacylglutathione hydrolase
MTNERIILGRVEVSPFVTNCYLLGCRRTGEALLIDPGGDPELIEAMVREAGLSGVRAIVNTHGHIDHVGAVGEFQRRWDIPFHLHPADSFLLQNLPAQAAAFGLEGVEVPRLDHPLADGERLELGDLRLEVIHTPGHTPGGVSLLVDHLLFTGDTLFAGSIGRTDLPGGSYPTLLDSIRRRLLEPLAGDTVVLPGHGPQTTLAEERSSNPFLV